MSDKQPTSDHIQRGIDAASKLVQGNKDVVLQAMREGGHDRNMSVVWGERFNDAVEFIARTTVPWRAMMGGIRDAKKERGVTGKFLIIATERSTHVDINQCLHDVCRNVGNDQVHVFFSGGVPGMEKWFDERMGGLMARDFFEATAPKGFPPESSQYYRVTSIDHTPQHTGHQGLLYAALVRIHRFTDVVLVMPMEHLPRFALTLMAGLELEESAATAMACQRSKNFVPPMKLRPVFHCMGVGAWDDHLTRGLSRAAEAFGPFMNPKDATHPTKVPGGELAQRLESEVNPNTNSASACPAAEPAYALKYLDRTL